MSLGRFFSEIYDVKPALKAELDALIHAASQKEYQNIFLVLSTLGNLDMTKEQVHVTINAKVKSGTCQKHLMAIAEEYFKLFLQHPEEKTANNPNVAVMLYLADRFKEKKVINMDAAVIEKLNAEMAELSLETSSDQVVGSVAPVELIKLKDILARFDKLINSMESLPAVYWDNEKCVNIFSMALYSKEACCGRIAEIYYQTEEQLEANVVNEVRMLEYRVSAYAVLTKLIVLLDKFPNKNLPSIVSLCQELEKSSSAIRAFYKESIRVANQALRHGDSDCVSDSRERLKKGLELFEGIEKAGQTVLSIKVPDQKFSSAILANKIGDFDLVGAVTYAYQMIEEQQGLKKTPVLSDPVILLEANKEVAETLSAIFAIEMNAYNLTPHSLSAFMKYYESLLVTFMRHHDTMVDALDKLCKKYQYTSVNEVVLFDSIIRGLVALSQIKPTGFQAASSASKALAAKSVELSRRNFLRVLSKMIPLLYSLNKTHFSSRLTEASAAQIAQFGGGFNFESGLEGLLDKVREQVKALPSKDKEPLTEKEKQELMMEDARRIKNYYDVMREYAEKKVALAEDVLPEEMEVETEIEDKREEEKEEIKESPTMSIAESQYYQAYKVFLLDHEAALPLYKKSLELAKQHADHPFVAASLSGVSSCYNSRARKLRKEEPLKAVTEYARANAIAKEALQYFEENVDAKMAAEIEKHSAALHLQVASCAADLARWVGELKAEKNLIDGCVHKGQQALMEVKSLRTEAEWNLGLPKDQQSVKAVEFDRLKLDQKNMTKLVQQVEHVINKMIPQAVCLRMLHNDKREFPLQAYLTSDNVMQKLALTAEGDFSERLIFMRQKKLLSIAPDTCEKPLSLTQSGHCYFKGVLTSTAVEPGRNNSCMLRA